MDMETPPMQTMQTPREKHSLKTSEWLGIAVLIVAVIVLAVYVLPNRLGDFGGEPNEFGIIPAQDVEFDRIERDLPDSLPFMDDEFLVGQVRSKVVQYPSKEKNQYDISYATVQPLRDVYMSYHDYTLASEEGLYPYSSSLPAELDEMTDGQWGALSQAIFEARGEGGEIMTVSFAEAGDITHVTVSYTTSR